jgi:hypothetical protein
MTDGKRARLILERWVAELPQKNRAKDNLANNFEELFESMSDANIPFDAAHGLLKEAIGHHFPTKSVAKFTYKNTRRDPNISFDDFLDGWKRLITDEATKAFYAFYRVEGENENKEEKKYGTMSAQEYMKQRRYADSFPTIDTDALQDKINDIMKDDLGGSDGE